MVWGTLRNALMALGLAAFAVGGCSPGDVQLNGKIFEAMGVSGNQKTGSIPIVAERAPLILPPSLERLPPPGSAPTVTDANFPVNPEQSGDQKNAKLLAEHRAYCKENYDKQLALGNRTAAETAIGPLGRCEPSALSALTGGNPLQGLEKN